MKQVLLALLVGAILLGAGCGNAPNLAETQAAAEGITKPAVLATSETAAFVDAGPEKTEPQKVAEYITEGLQVRVGGVDFTWPLTDRSHYSKKEVKPSESLVLESQTPFCSLYAVWDAAPGPYTLAWEGGQLECGQNGFLHEYIPLPEAVTGLEVRFREERTQQPCDFVFLTEGSAPEGVQVWQAPLTQADILVFPTHADDDVLFFGPLMAYYTIEKGLKIQTAFMVHHDEYPLRGHERLNAMWTMGLRNYPILGDAPDLEAYNLEMAINFYEDHDIERWQVEQIRRCKPLVVLGHDLEGEYGNAGHMVNAHYLVQAVEAASDPEKYPELAQQYGTWDVPKLYLHLYPEKEISFEVNTPLENDPLGRTPFEVATEAMAYHISQTQLGGFWVRQGDSREYDCRFFGLYRTLVGYDTTADIMENIDPKQWREK